MSANLLVINLGMGSAAYPSGYAPTTYEFSDTRTVDTSIAGLALWRWLEDTDRAPESVVFVCTAAAWSDKGPAVRAELSTLGLDEERLATPIHIELPRSLDDVWGVLKPLERWIKQRAPRSTPVLHIDVTHAYRAIPLAHSWLALYLQRLGLCSIGVVGYGAYQHGEAVTPYIDLAYLMRLADWAAAVRDLERRGDAEELSRLIGEEESTAKRHAYSPGHPPPDAQRGFAALGRAVNAARAAADFLSAGLPIELGLSVRRSLSDADTAAEIHAARRVLPAGETVLARLFGAVSRFAWTEAPARRSPKRTARLTAEEVQRQLALVSYWRERGALGDALRTLREAVVNRVILATRGENDAWLRRTARIDAEARLHELRNRTNRAAHPTHEKLARIWGELCEARNAFAHAGMQPNRVDPDKLGRRLQEIVAELRALWAQDMVWMLPPADPEPRNGD